MEVKGLDLLVKAWENIENKQGWTLTLVGDGHLKDNFKGIKGVIIKDFMTQRDLIKEMERAGCFVLASVFEPWALVIHEAAAAGLPIIATDACGASPHFVVSGYNGYQVNPSISGLQNGMNKIIGHSDAELIGFAANSRLLAKSISPQIGAAQLMSVLKSR